MPLVSPVVRSQHGEAGVAVLGSGTLAHHRADHGKVGNQIRARSAHHAVHRPDPAVLGEVRRVLGVPVLGVDHGGAGRLGRGDLGGDRADDVLAAPDVQRARRVGEVVLHVHHDQGGGRGVVWVIGRLQESRVSVRMTMVVGIAGSPADSFSPPRAG